MNLLTYVDSMPTQFSDPMGERSWYPGIPEFYNPFAPLEDLIMKPIDAVQDWWDRFPIKGGTNGGGTVDGVAPAGRVTNGWKTRLVSRKKESLNGGNRKTIKTLATSSMTETCLTVEICQPRESVASVLGMVIWRWRDVSLW